jgi:16S rRNA (guanine1516-N2)-methyltransferase
MSKNAHMNLTIIGGELSAQDSEFQEVRLFCEQQNLSITFEWIDGQYWLHSDGPKERPIGIQIDRELKRHEEYFKRSSIHNELLARAVGVKSGIRPKILDLTGGLLGDTLLFLSFGCEVVTIERHPIISFLIKSALHNAKHASLSRFTFLAQDASVFLAQKPPVDVIFFDPMFEDVNVKSSPKKEMRIFRGLVGSDKDAKLVFEMARELRPRRLVVKRPRLSVTLVENPQIVFEGKATRYDVYLS